MSGVSAGRIRPAGKHFTRGGRPFPFRGVTYGTFRPGPDGALFPDRDRVKRDFAAIHEHGFTVVRTYTEPPERVLEAAADWGLQLLVGAFAEDWRYLVGCSGRARRRLERAARRQVTATARRLAGCDQVLGVCVGNEVPADVVRWLGTRTVGRGLSDLVRAVHDADPEQLATYANYPTAEYLAVPEADFFSFNVFLEDRTAFRRYLTRLQHLAEDRPLVLSEMGAPSGPDSAARRRQAEIVDWQLATAVERGVGGTCLFSWTDDWWVAGESQEAWGFGLTTVHRRPKPALEVARRWNARTVADLDHPWPSMTVAVCAYNAAATLDECLAHTCALDYPNLEILVVDDGSTDETPAIAARHPRARLLRIAHGGLSVARNTAAVAASGELVAYLDADAYPSPDWPYYLALGLDGPRVGGVGGPNLPPLDDPATAHRVAVSPGGPAHVMLSDDRAEHVPGCNMAFWRDLVVDVGGFDPIYTSAGDDVDFCWRVLDRDWEIGFHPAAVVWHHPRATTRAYLRQQRGYGRSETLVEARHPDRFTMAGSARWRGGIYRPGRAAGGHLHQRIYRGPFGSAPYQSVYRGGGFWIDAAHQLGVPLAALMLLSAPLAVLSPALATPAVIGLALLGWLFALDAVRCRPPAAGRVRRAVHRAHVGLLHLLQPLARLWGRRQRRGAAGPAGPRPPAGLPARPVGRGVLVVPESRPRPELVGTLVAALRHRRLRVLVSDGWDAADAQVAGSVLVRGTLVTSSHPPGWVQIRLRGAVQPAPLSAVAGIALASAPLSPVAAAVLAGVALADVAVGGVRLRRARRVLAQGAAS